MTRKKTIAVDTWTKVSETDQEVISLFIPNRILDISRGDTVASRDAIQIVIDADDSTPTGDRQDRLVINAVTPYITDLPNTCLLYTSPSPRDRTRSRMPSSA